MQLTRYYEKQPIQVCHVRAVRDTLSSTLNWTIKAASYSLFYESEYYHVEKVDEAVAISAKMGQPAHVWINFVSMSGRTLSIETRLKRGISIDVDNGNDRPEPVLDAIESVLSLKRYGTVPSGRLIGTAFIAHGFHSDGQNYANEICRFLNLLGIKCYSGRSFAPGSVSDKVKQRLMKYDVCAAIVTPQEDDTWITQEMATAAALEKDLFILKQSEVNLKTGILGDHEYISFPKGELSRVFIPMLEGLNEICGIEPGAATFGTLKSGIELLEGNV